MYRCLAERLGCGSSASSLRKLYTQRARGNLSGKQRNGERYVNTEKGTTRNFIRLLAKGNHLSAPVLCKTVHLLLIVKLHVQLIVKAIAPISTEDTAQIKTLS